MKREMGLRRAARFAMVTVLAVAPAAFAQTVTHTTLTAETADTAGKTVATFSAAVTDAGGSPLAGVVTLVDGGNAISSAALDSDGKATIKLDSLTAGDHSIKAVYNGSSAYVASTSEAVTVHPQAAGAPDFGLGINPTTLSLAVGDAGTVKATTTSENDFSGFISFSCAGPPGATTLPYGITCSFAPANVQLASGGTASVEMSVQTSPGLRARLTPKETGNHGTPVILAVLFPGVFGLVFLGRRRKRLGQLVLLAGMAGAMVMGTTGCNPRYYYLNHGPSYPGATAGTYTLQVIAQTSNGVTASTHAVDLALTVTNSTTTSPTN